MKRLLPFLIAYLLAGQIIAQQPQHYMLGKDLFDGMYLYSIVQDENDNSMWISSNNGIYNYNSVSFTHHLPKESKSSALFGLTKDNNGSIFCYNLNGQVFKIDNKNIELYYTISKASKSISQILFDESNNLIIVTSNETITIPPDKKDILFDKNRICCIAKFNDTLYYSSVDTLTQKFAIYKQYKKSIKRIFKKDKSHRQLYVTDNKIYAFDRNENNLLKIGKNKDEVLTNLDFLKNRNFNMLDMGKKLLFFSSKKGTYIIPSDQIEYANNSQKWFEKYLVSGGVEDNEGNTWLLTFKDGIIVIPNLNNTLTESPNNTVFKGITKSNKHIYLATENGQIYRYHNQKLVPYFKADENDRYDFIKVIPEKNIVINNTSININDSSFNLNYCRDAVLVNDSLMLGLSNGLQSFNLNTRKLNQITYERTHNVYYDSLLQRTWISATNGIKQYKSGIVKKITANDKEILEAKIQPVNNQVWITSNKGIYIFEDDQMVQQITKEDGLLDNDIDNIKYEYPYVYLAYNRGIQRYDINTSRFDDFTFADGLTGSTTKFEVLRDTIYGINSEGLFSFTFDDSKKSIDKLQTRISEANANGNTPINENTTLEPEDNNIEFSFLTPTFKYQRDIRYEYQLQGYEKEATLAKPNQHFVRYPNLPAGQYTFTVNSFMGKQKNKAASLQFRIKKHWYDTFWFKIGIISLSLLMIYTLYRTRIKTMQRKRDKEAMKKRLAESSLSSLKAQMNPHFMFNTINSIQSLVLSKKPIEAYGYLTQLSDLIRKYLKMSDESFVTLQEQIESIEQYLELEKLRFEDDFNYKVDNTIQEEDIRLPSMIIQPFIENAVKHGLLHKEGQKDLSIRFLKEDRVLICEVTDNGIGRKASEKINSQRDYKSFSTDAIKKRFDILRDYYNLDVGFWYEDLYENEIAVGTKAIIKIIYV